MGAKIIIFLQSSKEMLIFMHFERESYQQKEELSTYFAK